MRAAGIDLGTNTFLCLIADLYDDGPRRGRIAKVLSDDVHVVRLGQGVQATRQLHPEALIRAESAFVAFADQIKRHNCRRVRAVATSAARDASNGHLLLELGRRYGIPIEIISGEREAELTFAGTLEPEWTGRTGIIDVGGGSTELIIGSQEGILARASADVGSVRLTEALVRQHPISLDTLGALRARVASALSDAARALGDLSATRVIGVAGTPTTLAAVDLDHAFESERVHGHVFSLSKLEQWISRLAAMTVEERQTLAGMEPKRADVIVSGAICLVEALRLFGQSSLQVSVRGLRYGVAEWSFDH